MTATRRLALSSLASLLALAFAPQAMAQAERTTIVAPFPPGGPNDVFARLIGQWLSDRLGQSFIVENRPGAAANVATDMVARSPADGYTLLVISSNNVINTTLYGTVDFAREIAPIATFGRGDFFGEIAILQEGARRATARAQTDVELAEIRDFLARHAPFDALRKKWVEVPTTPEGRQRTQELARLPDGAGDLARAFAVLGRPAPLRQP